jgi:hypothetical protein
MTLATAARDHGTDDEDDDAPIQRIVAAGTEAPPITRAPVSIFTVAKVLRVCKKRRKARLEPVRGEPTKVIEVQEGVTRVVGRGYPSDRWTPEKEQQEVERRARQRPPKPTRKARTRSKKLLDLIGADDADS